ncbi:restriction endonuclease [Vibrio parahaemolyticus]|uniref:restriction endonuclease n=1 Tax=Vibrio parahaemolyticus TaxID=670 RepID=UPI002119EBD9|nr:restriction endonuclease [Vibrio parahaemolyticus]MCQ9095778.1 restriction endonuclease [Vibrio parahaemolyticus]HCG8095744.1 restriction endonuclease [Vibrio parahaemolyticus]HCH6158822.1 restriction endonuclease [Vibrio parahaemolyticus]
MAKKNDGIIWHLMDAPWWVSVLFALGIYVGLSYLLPSLAMNSDNFVFKAVGQNLPAIAPYFTFLFLIPAPIAFFKQHLRAKSYQTTTGQILSRKDTKPMNSLSWIEFESYIGEYFKHQGYKVKQDLSHKPDGGVDIWLTKDGELTLVQCKHWKVRKVGIQVLREMYAVMIENQASKMMIITSGNFTSEAVAYAQGKRLWLINGSELVHMIEDGRNFVNNPIEKSVVVEPKQTLCPNCQSVLVERVARRGINAGKLFLGCSSFPKCRFTREV